jgi:ArsR family transcriptional regulator
MKKLLAAPDALMGWMGSLADPIRLRLLRLVEKQELAVDELRDVLQLPQSTVSRHLKVLVDEGFTRSRRHGTTHLYRTILDELEAPARKLWLVAREQTENWPTVQQDQLRLARRLRERQTDSQTFFSATAGQWDKLRSELYGDACGTTALMALLPPEWEVADLGCGTGWASEMLAAHVRQVIAVDSSAAMLKAARTRTAHLANVDLRRGELEALPLQDACCDAALLLLALTYSDDPQKVISEMSRILKPGGRAIVMDLLPHDRDDFRRQMGQRSMGFAAETMTDLMTACGFADAVVRTLPPQPNTKGPALFLASAIRVN